MTILLEIPVQPLPNQRLSIVLNGQQTTIDIYLQDKAIFCDVFLPSGAIIRGMHATHGSYINQYKSKFSGYLFWWDSDGLDPNYETMGTVSRLFYSDYNILEISYAAWVVKNKADLL